jgi:hypothetical protein
MFNNPVFYRGPTTSFIPVTSVSQLYSFDYNFHIRMAEGLNNENLTTGILSPATKKPT